MGFQEFFDDTYPQETAFVPAPCMLYDDFLQPSLVVPLFGALESGADWAKQIVGTATTVGVTGQPGGMMSVNLPAAAAAQCATLDKGNELNFVLNQGLVFEAKICLHTLPTIGAIACVGLCSAHNNAPDTVAESIWFRWDFATGGLITVENDDTLAGHETSKVTTGRTLIADEFVVLKIDCEEIDNIKFFIDGIRVAAGTVFNMNTVAALQLQPVVRISAAAADSSAGSIYVDYIKVWQRRV
jgi:hypothetical protein